MSLLQPGPQRRPRHAVEVRRSILTTAQLVALLGCLPLIGLLLPGEVQADPRIPLVQYQLEERWLDALESVERLQQLDPEQAQSLGLDVLKGHLLLQLDRRQDAIQSFAQAMGSTPSLAPYSRFRLATEQESMGNAQVAAGLVATLLGGETPSILLDEAMRLLERTVEAGGDCRLLRPLEQKRWSTTHRRRLQRLGALCDQRAGKLEEAQKILFRLLEEKRDDDIGLNAVHALRSMVGQDLTLRQRWLIGMALYQHRQFDLAIPHLARTSVQLSGSDELSRQDAFECRYALARSHFWLGHYTAAAEAFGALAAGSSQPRLKAQCFYQQGRTYELNRMWPRALESFTRSLQAEPEGRWSDAALIASMRLHWLSGQQTEGLQKLADLKRRRRHNTTSRALIFLASSDIVDGRGDRAGDWLRTARSLGRVSAQELAYWEGRLAEVRHEWDNAVQHHVEALAANAYHPYGVAARQRLQSPDLLAASQQYRVRWQTSQRRDELFRAYLLSLDRPQDAATLHQRLLQSLRQDAAVVPFLDMQAKEAGSWPLWQHSLSRPDEMLLALGIFDQAAPAVRRHFPVAQPSMALTGSRVLAQAGATRRSLYVAEILAKRIPDRLPSQLLTPEYRQLLYPFRYSYLIQRETRSRGVDPFLLAGLIREESRFDPRAFSAAAARGLTQFILPTAERIAKTHDLGPIKPQDLERPEVSIRLGAAYLSQLLDEFDGSIQQTVAAYNAGEPQAALWRRYCRSDGIDEYLAKVAFRETRNYLAKVLTSRAHYQELYGPNAAVGPPPAARGDSSARTDQ